MVVKHAIPNVKPHTRAMFGNPSKYSISHLRHVRAQRSGKIALISVFTLLLFAILIIYVANVGRAVSEKIELQNAADATAYSTAIWEARSLNAITTTNHLMGELTAVTVILDSFGGTMLGENSSYESDESKRVYQNLDDYSEAFIKESYTAGPTYSSKFLNPLDETVVSFIVGDDGLMTKDQGVHEAGAAIYDAKLALQTWASYLMAVKDKANVGMEIAAVLEKFPPVAWLGAIIEAASVGIHLYMTKELVEKMGKEWLILDATEKAIAVVNANGAVRKAIFEAGLPALSIYADSVVGSRVIEKMGGVNSTSFKIAARETQSALKQSHGLESAETMPTWDKLRLPVVEEEPPVSEELPASQTNDTLGTWEYPPSNWNGNFTSTTEIAKIKRALSPINDAVKQINDYFGPLLDLYEYYDNATDWLGGSLPIPQYLKDAFEKYDQIDDWIKRLQPLPDSDPPQSGFPENPCLQESSNYDLPKFYWQPEQKSQWVRATYPYVDEYRAPVIKFYKRHCKYSDFATYYSHYSNRYTLANSFLARKSASVSNESQTDPNAGLLQRLKAEVARLRRAFEDATDDTDEENAGSVDTGKFKKVSSDLMKVWDEFNSRLSAYPALKKWFDEVAGHRQLVQSLRDSVTPPEGTLLENETVKGLAEEMALINVLDELLTLLEEFVALFEIQEPHMYVLQGMDPETKGESEAWIHHQKTAEKLFCVTAKVTRNPPEIFGAGLFAPKGPRPRTAFATAMVYNANGRDMKKQNQRLQPNTGWDTLNWEAPIQAPEWGDHRPSVHGKTMPWQLIRSRRTGKSSRVKINWRVKLVPISFEQWKTIEKSNDEDQLQMMKELFAH